MNPDILALVMAALVSSGALDTDLATIRAEAMKSRGQVNLTLIVSRAEAAMSENARLRMLLNTALVPTTPAPEPEPEPEPKPPPEPPPPSPIDCVVSAWSEWSACEAGTQRRTRTIAVQPEHGGQACPTLVETQACEVAPPPPPPPPPPEPEPSPDRPIVRVPAGGSLQAALNTAKPGSLVLLSAGVTYTGNVTLPAKACEPVTTITTEGVTLTPGARVTTSDKGKFAILRAGNPDSAIKTALGTCGWELRGLEFLPNVNGNHELIAIGDGWAIKNLADLPRNITLTHLLMAWADDLPQKRCVGANGINVTVADSHIAGCWLTGQDSQAIAAWNTPGPLTIRNNRLEAGSEVFLIGGADPGIVNVITSDVLFEGNYVTRPLAWRGVTKYAVKNLFQLKAGRRVTVRRNVFEHNWPAAQSGFAILFMPRNQSGAFTAGEVSDVLFEQNVVRKVSMGVNLLEFDRESNLPAGRLRNITIRDNFFDISRAEFGGTGRFLLVQGNAQNLHVEHNTVRMDGTQFLSAYGPQSFGFRWVGNLHIPSGLYGTHIEDASGQNQVHWIKRQEHFPDGEVTGNAFADWQGGAATRTALPGNIFPALSAVTIDADGHGTGTMAGYGRRKP